MRLPIIAVALVVMPAMATAQTYSADATINGKPVCENPSARSVGKGLGQDGGVHKLGEMPPAKQYLAVLNKVDGCSKPIVLRRGIGEKQR